MRPLTTPLAPALTLALALCLGLAACSTADGGDGVGSDGTALAASYLDRVQAEVDRQVAADIPLNPLGRVMESCLVADLQALENIGEGLAVTDSTPELLNVVVQDPDAAPVIQCAVRYGESSAGAVVLSVTASAATPDEVRADLIAQGFEETPDATAAGLDDDRVLLFDATSFAASRVVWVADGLQVSLTANADIADTGALLDALPIAVDEVTRVLS